ncbi:unnamed protein product [Cuscuta epithymum]|uniref:Uncharacterized protein n=1 Tax=Cuscuta epithymum TaxID=186058 RepID=A0AAV0CXV3_9ASTE|nr:unnamed protein product [Cuscuta epithymum]
MIADISKLCDAAVAWCSAQEERLKKPFMDLPIWEPSPHKLIYSLCQETFWDRILSTQALVVTIVMFCDIIYHLGYIALSTLLLMT